MPTRRPSLSAPTYGSLTGGINWSRGMNERLATPSSTLFAPPVQAAAAPAPKATTYGTPTVYGSPDYRLRMHNYTPNQDF